MRIQTLITAHSGCEGTPDNSLEYIRFALGCGADALEVDVRFREDGLYISHDSTGAACPSLKEVFALARESGMKLNCDLKEPGLEERVLELARSCGLAERLCFSGDVSPEALKNPAVRERTLWNVENAVPFYWERWQAGIPFTEEDARQAARVCREHGVRAVNVHYRFCTPAYMAAFRESGVGVSAWTVDSEEEVRRLLEAGAFNITSRRPRMALALRDGIS